MKVCEVIEKLEQLSPTRFACSWDNIGLLVGRNDQEVLRIGISLDATNSVIEKAVQQKIDLLITHHPVIFSSLKRINDEDFLGRKILKLTEHKIACYAMHTNFDVLGGMAQLVEKKLGLFECVPLEVTAEEEGTLYGIGSVSKFPEKMSLQKSAEFVKEKFHLPHVAIFGNPETMVQRVAICAGSGRGMIEEVLKKGAEVFITGDIGHHEGLDALDQGVTVIDAGHYGLEHIFMEFMEQYLKERIPALEIQVIDSQNPFTII